MHHVWKLLRVCLTISCVLGLLWGSSRVWAQTPSESPATTEHDEKQTIMLGLLRSIEQVEQEVEKTQRELRSPQGEGRKDELTAQIRKLGAKLATLRKNLQEVAAGVELSVFTQKRASEVDWKERFLDLLRPILSEMTRLTTRPREIEELRSTITDLQLQQRVAEKGLNNITQFASQLQERTLMPHMRKLQREWEARRDEISTQLRIAQQQLKQKIDEQPSLGEAARNLLQLFFRSRGRNFVVAFLASLGFWLFFHYIHQGLHALHFFHSRSHAFSLRLFHVLYNLGTVIGATFCFLTVLYVFKDWILLTLAVLFLLGIAWTSKQTLPRFLREVMLLLNMGAVREGERVVYNGVPWLVKALNVYTRLENPELEGGEIRLPLRDLHDLRSRPSKPGELWFPTRLNDWVLLADQELGKVTQQTPEIVRVVLLGGIRRTFSVQDFLAQSPRTLSAGFRLEVTFGLDYQHQAISTETIPTALEAQIHQALDEGGHTHALVNLHVEFAQAGASSLDQKVLADFSGEAAPQYHVLNRAIQRICVETCNAHGWVIPFTQLTLHVADSAHREALPLQQPSFDESTGGAMSVVPE